MVQQCLGLCVVVCNLEFFVLLGLERLWQLRLGGGLIGR